MRGSLVDKDSESGKRVYALIGEDATGLPDYFVERLDRIITAQQAAGDAAPSGRRLRLVRADRPSLDETRATATCEGQRHRWRSQVAEVAQTVQRLTTILESLYAVHQEQYDEADETMLTPHLVEGLFLTGRQLARSAGEALERMR